jgi:hypothetical protein
MAEWRVENPLGIVEFEDMREALAEYRRGIYGRLYHRDLGGEWLLIAWGPARRPANAVSDGGMVRVEI